jgi:hypothetical protein
VKTVRQLGLGQSLGIAITITGLGLGLGPWVAVRVWVRVWVRVALGGRLANARANNLYGYPLALSLLSNKVIRAEKSVEAVQATL